MSHFYPAYPDDFTYHHIYAYDRTDFDILPNLQMASSIIRNVVSKGGNIYIHCMQGVSRSVTVTIAYLITKYPEKTIDELLEFVKYYRKVANPNPAFITQLRKYSNY